MEPPATAMILTFLYTYIHTHGQHISTVNIRPPRDDRTRAAARGPTNGPTASSHAPDGTPGGSRARSGARNRGHRQSEALSSARSANSPRPRGGPMASRQSRATERGLATSRPGPLGKTPSTPQTIRPAPRRNDTHIMQAYAQDPNSPQSRLSNGTLAISLRGDRASCKKRVSAARNLGAAR
jgi:hypothetical protein